MDELKKLLENAGVKFDFDDMPGSDEDFARDFGVATKRPEEDVVAEIVAMLWNYAEGDPYMVDGVMEKVHAQLLQMQIKNNKR